MKFYGCKLLKIKHALVKIQTYLCRSERKLSEEKLNYLICNAVMDMCHVPHGEGLGFESGAGLSIPLVLLSSLHGVFGDDTFFRHTFLGVVFRPLSFVTPEISYAGFFISHFFDCEA